MERGGAGEGERGKKLKRKLFCSPRDTVWSCACVSTGLCWCMCRHCYLIVSISLVKSKEIDTLPAVRHNTYCCLLDVLEKTASLSVMYCMPESNDDENCVCEDSDRVMKRPPQTKSIDYDNQL